MFRIFGHYVPKELFLLCSTEILVLLITVYLIISNGLGVSAPASPMDATIWLHAFVFSLVMLTVMISMGMYHRVSNGGFTSTLGRITLSFVLGAILLSLLLQTFSDSHINSQLYAMALGCAFISIIVCRLIWQLRNNRVLKQRTLVIGAGKKAREVQKLTQNLRYGYPYCWLSGC